MIASRLDARAPISAVMFDAMLIIMELRTTVRHQIASLYKTKNRGCLVFV